MAFSNDKPDTVYKHIGDSRIRLSKMFLPLRYVYDDTVILKDTKIVFVNIFNFSNEL